MAMSLSTAQRLSPPSSPPRRKEAPRTYDAQSVKESLWRLSPLELSEVIEAARIISASAKGSTTDSSDRAEGLFYSTVSDRLERRISYTSPPIGVFRASSGGAKILSRAEKVIRSFAEKSFDIPVKTTTMIEMYELYARLVIFDMLSGPAPVTMKTVLQAADRFPGLVDQQFPGYGSSPAAIRLLISQSSKSRANRLHIVDEDDD